MMLDAGLPCPRNSASLNALRSIARLAASRTRRSAQGDFGSHCSVNTTHWLTVGSVTLRVRPGVRFTSSDRKSTRLNSSHGYISYAVFCLKKKNNIHSKKMMYITICHISQDNATRHLTTCVSID